MAKMYDIYINTTIIRIPTIREITPPIALNKLAIIG